MHVDSQEVAQMLLIQLWLWEYCQVASKVFYLPLWFQLWCHPYHRRSMQVHHWYQWISIVEFDQEHLQVPGSGNNLTDKTFKLSWSENSWRNPGWSELILIGRLTILVLVGCGILWIPILESQNNSQLFDYIQSVIHFLCPPIGIGLIFGSIKLQRKIWTDLSGCIRYGNILGENKRSWCILGTCCWTHYGNRSDDYCFYYSGTWLWWTRYQDRAYQFYSSAKLPQLKQVSSPMKDPHSLVVYIIFIFRCLHHQ